MRLTVQQVETIKQTAARMFGLDVQGGRPDFDCPANAFHAMGLVTTAKLIVRIYPCNNGICNP